MEMEERLEKGEKLSEEEQKWYDQNNGALDVISEIDHVLDRDYGDSRRSGKPYAHQPEGVPKTKEPGRYEDREALLTPEQKHIRTIWMTAPASLPTMWTSCGRPRPGSGRKGCCASSMVERGEGGQGGGPLESGNHCQRRGPGLLSEDGGVLVGKLQISRSTNDTL